MHYGWGPRRSFTAHDY